MQIDRTDLPGVLILTPKRFGDERGFFSESWNKRTLLEAGLSSEFVQDNHSLSTQKGTLRGLHFQIPPHAQAKLVRCGQGALLDVAVDIRQGSPTFGHSVMVELSASNGRQLFIPEGFAHGFVSLMDNTEILYKCSDYYAPTCDRSIAFDDPDLSIEWPISRSNAVLSDKDANAPRLRDLSSPFVWEE